MFTKVRGETRDQGAHSMQLSQRRDLRFDLDPHDEPDSRQRATDSVYVRRSQLVVSVVGLFYSQLTHPSFCVEQLYLTKDIVRNIEHNRDKFNLFLKKMNFQSVGRFNPVRVVEE